MVIITVVRHGQTEMNRANVVQTRTHGDLTPEGVRMAEELGKSLQNVKFTRVYSSDLKRCEDTTKNILKHSNYFNPEGVILTEDLRERDFGDFELKSYQFVSEYLEKELGEHGASISYRNIDVPNGETYTSVLKRCGRFVEILCEIADAQAQKSNVDEDDEHVLVVSHGIWIHGLFEYFYMNKDFFQLENFPSQEDFVVKHIPNTGRTKVILGKVDNNGKRVLKFIDWSCTAHLTNGENHNTN